VKSLMEALHQLGVKYALGGKTTPPVTIEGGTMKGGKTELPGNISSQFISALLLIAPFGQKEMEITLTTAMTSTPYVLMTIWCLKQFGINIGRWGNRFVVKRQRYVPTRVEIEGDWSSASYLIGLGAVSAGGITVENLSTGSLQGDRVILDYIRRMGAVVSVGTNSITVREGKLKAIRADLTDSIDLLPTIAVLASLADGISELTGIGRARIKESDRVTAMVKGLMKLGIKVKEDKDRMIITGKKTPLKIEESKAEDKQDEKAAEPSVEELFQGPPVISSFGDHRIAMAFSIFGAAEGGVTIEGAECVAKTYPEFWQSFKAVGGEMMEDV
jgi:3-phosphoshikimate 1-carboxyvinyltransferase